MALTDFGSVCAGLQSHLFQVHGGIIVGFLPRDKQENGDSEPITQHVFVLNGRMCEVAGTINAIEPLARQLLILHHIEGLDADALADAHGLSADEIREALAEAEGQFIELLSGLSGWEDGSEPDVRALLVELADCIDLAWAQGLGEFAMHYAAEWKG